MQPTVLRQSHRQTPLQNMQRALGSHAGINSHVMATENILPAAESGPIVLLTTAHCVLTASFGQVVMVEQH